MATCCYICKPSHLTTFTTKACHRDAWIIRQNTNTSGCDKRIGFRRTGWSPLGVAPVQVARFHRGNRYQILPAYTQDGVLLSRVFQGTTDSDVYEDFIEQLLQHCGRWPEPKSLLVMDNASFHHSDGIKQLCSDAGVKFVYFPPYTPDLNPIEEFFAELKAFIKKIWQEYEDNPMQDFGAYLEWCVNVAGGRKRNAVGHIGMQVSLSRNSKVNSFVKNGFR